MGFGYYYMDMWYFVLVIPALIISLIAQYKVKSNGVWQIPLHPST